VRWERLELGQPTADKQPMLDWSHPIASNLTQARKALSSHRSGAGYAHDHQPGSGS
jgi:hypothetical protein